MKVFAKMIEPGVPDRNGRVYSKLAVERVCKTINEQASELFKKSLEEERSQEDTEQAVMDAIKNSRYRTKPINIFDYVECCYNHSNHGLVLKFNKPDDVSEKDWEESLNQFYRDIYGYRG